jgi:hypothetical protein
MKKFMGELLMKKVLFVVLILACCTTAQAQTMFDATFSKSIETVLLYPSMGEDSNPKKQVRPAVLALTDAENLLLEFDDFDPQYQNYHIRIVPCTPTWELARLNDIEYLKDFNDLIISNYQLSYATKLSYYHYKVAVPKTKIGGNFLVQIYKNSDKANPVLQRRFMVNANRILVAARVTLANNNSKRATHQQVDFTINYGRYQVVNPRNDFYVVIRKNFNWNQTIKGLKPQFDRAGQATLDFNFYNDETTLDAGNEYHLFDMRTLRTKLVGVRKIEQFPDSYKVFLYTDQQQSRKSYIQMDDFDGQFLVDTYEGTPAATEGDYGTVQFQLSAPDVNFLNEDVYVLGGFNHHQPDPKSKLKFNTVNNTWEGGIKLKQGIYNYTYGVKDKTSGAVNYIMVDGNYSRAQNTYEVLVYHKPMGGRSLQLVGYTMVNFNGR